MNKVDKFSFEEKIEYEEKPFSTEEMEETEEVSTTHLEEEQFEKYVVSIRRVAKVLKGGKRLSFSAAVVVGNKNGVIGYAVGKANEVPAAIDKAARKAMKNLVQVKIVNGTIPHQVMGRCGTSNAFVHPQTQDFSLLQNVTFVLSYHE